ncbi:Activator of stress genes 1 like protein [Verticillium longisporum]|nr:Cytochrome c oxidase polypeptide VI [Verticillium dahliae VDG2]KAF3359075.1 hypothetical protein VdG1_02637 [Verticillium dahliae VDG1]KAG7140763.1 Activator of stress genes 1 like protein [Verticillium longisporum]KAH6698012.1 hypothetical protein EV126DRAFT_515424 [Verticillium dahliae]PNH28007.1 hypothetical protein BJF96_g8695 [Verticillium dahliae]
MPTGRPVKRPADAFAGDVTNVVLRSGIVPSNAADPIVPSTTHDATDQAATSQGKVKLPRVENRQTQEDFSAQVKNRLNSFTRTGQACDRCKVRKIKCDALPEGCSHCLQQSIDCYVTDRVSGRTERRGYLQDLEREKKDMAAHIKNLESLLADNGIQVQPWTWSKYPTMNGPPGVTLNHMGQAVETDEVKGQWTQIRSVWVKNYKAEPAVIATRLKNSARSALESRPADIHIGVGPDIAPMNAIKGTKLTILGTTIDLASFNAPDMDEPGPDVRVAQPLYNKSIQAYLQSTMNINPPPHVKLPSRAEAFELSQWYFVFVFPFLPVLHKPTYLEMLAKIYDDPSFQPTVAELVMVHMVVASIYYQQSLRAPPGAVDYNELSNRHYHFALGKFFDLASSQTISAVQAMAMIAAHGRSFPKPGCGFVVAHYAFLRAVDMNLHRAVKQEGETTNLDLEIRKRTWWTILAVCVTLAGRLGRPMPITVDEYDIEFPEPVADELLTPDGLLASSSTSQCEFHPGLAGFRIIPLLIEMYTNIYSVKRDPTTYVDVVDTLEEKLRMWKEDHPPSLRPDLPTNDPQDGQQHMYQLYVEMMELELRLALRSPSVAMTTDRKILAENSHICEETAARMLEHAKALHKLKCLDVTWYQIAIFAAAMFTTLVAHWERRFDPNEQSSTLRRDMTDWLSIIHSIAVALGSGEHIYKQLSAKVDSTLRWIEHDRQQQQQQQQQRQQHRQRQQQEEANAHLQSQLAAMPEIKQEIVEGSFPASSGPQAVLPTQTVPSMAKAYYDDPNHNGGTAYSQLAYTEPTTQAGMLSSYDSSYLYPASTPESATSIMNSGISTANHNPLVAFASQATQQVIQPESPAVDQYLWRHVTAPTAQGTNWGDWAAAMSASQERYGANALLNMGTVPRETHVPADMVSMNAASAGQWPTLLWNDNQSEH